MRCPMCELELGVERRAGELVLTYSLKELAAAGCRARGDPARCCHMLPTILTMLPECKAAPFRSEPRKKDEQ